MEEETIRQLFYYSTHIQDIWNQVQTYFTDGVHFSQLTPQTAIFGFYNIDNNTFLFQNQILLLFKLHIYNARKYGFLSFNNFLDENRKIKNLEKRVAVNNRNKCDRFMYGYVCIYMYACACLLRIYLCMYIWVLYWYVYIKALCLQTRMYEYSYFALFIIILYVMYI